MQEIFEEIKHISNETSSIAENLLAQATILNEAMDMVKEQVDSQNATKTKVIKMAKKEKDTGCREAA